MCPNCIKKKKLINLKNKKNKLEPFYIKTEVKKNI